MEGEEGDEEGDDGDLRFFGLGVAVGITIMSHQGSIRRMRRLLLVSGLVSWSLILLVAGYRKVARVRLEEQEREIMVEDEMALHMKKSGWTSRCAS